VKPIECRTVQFLLLPRALKCPVYDYTEMLGLGSADVPDETKKTVRRPQDCSTQEFRMRDAADCTRNTLPVGALLAINYEISNNLVVRSREVRFVPTKPRNIFRSPTANGGIDHLILSRWRDAAGAEWVPWKLAFWYSTMVLPRLTIQTGAARLCAKRRGSTPSGGIVCYGGPAQAGTRAPNRRRYYGNPTAPLSISYAIVDAAIRRTIACWVDWWYNSSLVDDLGRLSGD
jgi:hypothetical protein